MQTIYLKLVLTMAIWGGTFIAGRIIAQEISPFTASFYRFAIATICLIFFIYRQPAKLPKLKTHQIPIIILLGFSGVFAYNVFFFLGLQTIAASRAGLIIALNPVSIALSSRLIFKEKLTSLKIIGIAISLLGVAFIITEGDLTTLFSGGVGKGELYILGCVGSWGIYSLAGKKAMQELSSLVTTTYAIIVGTITLLPLALQEQFKQGIQPITPLSCLSLLYLGILGTVVAFNWYYDGIQAIGAAKASIFINLVPVFALVFGIIFLQESISSILLIGGSLVITGVSLVNKK
ncbi:conserved membrane hypothetical protein [Hyella patelloides LEGE 07179]|uniref:EamA domain-containing protein n=1 Tax=Hyella patelloides LEGE 07179 TaxID=945734 RepID=A0A563VZT2_9CYAN|nr:DMT family transporter [Hyella patelloides]VEP16968.1 conserved membrane hypothetical protein [Hyella patelloides LEGE 07179]